MYPHNDSHLAFEDLATSVSNDGYKSSGASHHSVAEEFGEGRGEHVLAITDIGEEYITHTVKLLEEFSNRQVHPPFDDRIKPEFPNPYKFLLGTFQSLANRDKPKAPADEPSRRLPPQLLTEYVDLEVWAKEYLRVQFDQSQTGSLVPTLLTVIAANFFDLYMHLMDNIVKKALVNKDTRRGSCLEITDFSFSYELHLSQVLPFITDAKHRVHNARIPNSQPPSIDLSRKPVPSAKPVRSGAGASHSGRKMQPPKAVVQTSQLKKSRPRPKATPSAVKKGAGAQIGTGEGGQCAKDKEIPSERHKVPRTPAQASTSALRPKGRPRKSIPEKTATKSSTSPLDPPSLDPPLGDAPTPEVFPFTFQYPYVPNMSVTGAPSEDLADFPTPEGTMIGYESDATILALPLETKSRTSTPALEETTQPPAPKPPKRLTIVLPARKSERLARKRDDASTSLPSLPSNSLQPVQSEIGGEAQMYLPLSSASEAVPGNPAKSHKTPTCPSPPPDTENHPMSLTAGMPIDIDNEASSAGSRLQNPLGDTNINSYPSVPPEAMSLPTSITAKPEDS
ncbi:hypothetical protein FPV67DRAFT_1149213 [Lyophyllum atratum]|nr:hypothetical protein FPV67DRAFT_1149213 [Lyophyllum atratum]